MATSSAASLEEAQELQRQLCRNCHEVCFDEGSLGFMIRGKHGEPIGLKIPREYHEKVPTGYSLTDDLPQLPKLKISSRQGCSLCGYLRDMILSKHTMEFIERHYGTNTTNSGFPGIEVTIRLSWVLNDPLIAPSYLCANVLFNHANSYLTMWSHVTAATDLGNEDLAKWLPILGATVPLPSYPCDIEDAFYMEEMKFRIHQCKRGHNHTLPSVDYTPERLLDVREDPPKLISSSGLLSQPWQQTPRYTALSYCWGTSEEATHQLTTTHESMPERQRGIQYDEMPPVLRDAINVTKSLDIPFLWIDALCIIQGDTSDWEKQCPQMDKIYGHAEVTLVAASSNSCRDSFLHPEAPRTLLPFSSKRRERLGGLLQVRFSGCTEASSSRQYFSDLNDSRLATRGWAVQERILSTRMITFGKTNVQFVCPTQSARVDQIDRGYFINGFRKSGNKSSHFYWTKLLDKYQTITVESFTQPTDLLPTLSGLAAYFGNRTKDRYCAGHWHQDLYRSLMWCSLKTSRDPQTRHASRACSPSSYIVPSWSRLGKGNSFALDKRFRRPTQETLKLDAHIVNNGENPFGAIRDAQLEVRTHTMCLRTATNIELTKIELVTGKPFSPDPWKASFVQSDKSALYSEDQHRFSCMVWDKHRFSCSVWVDYDLGKEEVRRDAEEWKWVLLGASLDEPFGLLLSRADDSKWCRVGVFAPSMGIGSQHERMKLSDFMSFSSVETLLII